MDSFNFKLCHLGFKEPQNHSAANGAGDPGLDFAAGYLDNVIVFSSDFDDHIAHLQTVFKRFRKLSLTDKAKKCEYFGHVVGSGTI